MQMVFLVASFRHSPFPMNCTVNQQAETAKTIGSDCLLPSSVVQFKKQKHENFIVKKR
jgi:hypothetical protein